MRDTKPGSESDLMWYPPEPFFTHPIAKAVAAQMTNKEVLTVIPPSHHHMHNYMLHLNGVMCVVVGRHSLVQILELNLINVYQACVKHWQFNTTPLESCHHRLKLLYT